MTDDAKPQVWNWKDYIGHLIGILGFVFAIWSHFANQRFTNISAYISSARTVVVKQGETSRLKVYSDGAPINSDVTALRVQIWNAGTEPVKADSVLRSLAIHLSPSRPILEARVLKASSQLSGVGLDSTNFSDGSVGINWQILEPGDAALIQVTYAGSVETQAKVEGSFVGQRQVRTIVGRDGLNPYTVRLTLLLGIFAFCGVGLSLRKTHLRFVSRRQELAEMLRRTGTSTLPFEDAPSARWSFRAVSTVLIVGILVYLFLLFESFVNSVPLLNQ